MRKKENILLSVVIPCKNEEKNIKRCLESIIQNTAFAGEHEIILVDSFSKDNSVALAQEYPVRILQLKKNWLHSSAAARYIGCLNARGKYIFIIDADMELLGGFLEKAVVFMEKDHTVAAVAGIGKEVQLVNGKEIQCVDNLYHRDTVQICDADYLGGAALYRRIYLEQEGLFMPYLYSQEELELCQRLKQKWQVLTLPYPMSVHYTYPNKSMKLFKKHLDSNRFTGMGQLLRYSFGTCFFWPNFLRFKKFVFPLIFIVIIICSILILIIGGNAVFLAGGAAIIILFCLYLVIRGQSLKQALLRMIVWPCIIFTFSKGLFLKPKAAQDYPRDVKIIKR